MSTFLSGLINVSQAILGTSESGLMSCQHYKLLHEGGYKQIQIKLYIKPISVFIYDPHSVVSYSSVPRYL